MGGAFRLNAGLSNCDWIEELIKTNHPSHR